MWALTFLATLVLAVIATSEPPAHTFELDAGFDDLVEQLLNLFRVPGFSLAVIKDSKITSKGYGYASLPDTPATPDTLWYTASTTKAFVATAAGLLVQDDSLPQFKWSTPMSQLMPGDFALSEEYQTTHTTLEDALSHRSGLPRHDLSYGWGNATALDVARRLRYLPLTAEPRTRWQYSNSMYGTVGVLLEQHTGLRLGEVLTEWIWGPLGMQSTTFSLDKAAASGNFATGYHWDVDSGAYIPEQLFNVTATAGAGATISSMNDYAIWVRALLAAANGETNHTSPLTNTLLNQLWTPRSFMNIEAIHTNDPASMTYGLGWMSIKVGEHSVITHSGGLPGFGTQVFLVPKLNFGFVSAGNNMAGAANAGGVLFLALLKNKKFDPFDPAVMGTSDFKQILQQLPLVSTMTPETWSEKEEEEEEIAPLTKASQIPLPGHITDYLGLYEHPAYGTFNVSFLDPDTTQKLSSYPPSSQTPLLHAPEKEVEPEQDIHLLVEPSLRTFKITYILTHRTNAIFNSELYWIHGPTAGNDRISCGLQQKTPHHPLKCKDEAVWEKLGGRTRAVFESGLDGQVDSLGMELEPEQTRAAKERGEDRWRDGMIWFVKKKA